MISTRRTVQSLLAGLAVVAGSLIIASPAQAYSTCNGSVYRSGTGNWDAIRVPAYNGSTSCNLRNGNYNNNAVELLQNALNRCSLDGWNPGLTIDGDFGNATYNAVRNNQQYIHDLGTPNTVDGIYGPNWDLHTFLWPSDTVIINGLPAGPCDFV